ncbi:helix-turn-helix domain-containing protein [Nocardia jejuensis]|uniref:helix-turn-helix domain-containing protein n=1 Tax=Nocardia jejuensis TaxID=328049 RepID=UPI0008315F6B|nr:helix-turn-helix transcriptional regulator [Nocardia jejuensis]
MAGPSTLPRILLGLELKALREGTDIRMDDAATLSGISKPTLWRIESGNSEVRLNPVLIGALCKVYEATPEQTKAILKLINEAASDEKGWWHGFSDAIPKEFNLFVRLEDAAQKLISYQTTFIPGQLQTLEYRRALSWIEFPNRPSREIERMLQVGMKRQARITRNENALRLEVVIDEAVLRRSNGGNAVMEGQLKHLAAMAELPNVSLRVVPRTADIYQGLLAGTFVLFEFPPRAKADLTCPPIVYVQGFTGGLYLKEPEKVSQYRQACAALDRQALEEGDSRRLVLEIVKEYAE